jgi:hypothetical protein
MNSLERQRRLTKLLAMVQTTRMALWALSNAASEDEAPNDDDPIIGELTEADENLHKAAEVLARSLLDETAGR